MKIMLGQINTTPCDFFGNYEQIKEGYEKAVAEDADIIVFPELSIPGYLVADTIYRKSFVEDNLQSLQTLCELSVGKKTYMVVGYVDNNNTGVGKPFKNMLAVIHRGMIIGTYQKWLLPFYDVFDEPRYFQAGHELLVMDIAGKKCGFTICEDIWNDKGQDDYNYKDNPVQAYKDLGVQVLINISSSPYQKDKPRKRQEMLREIASDFEYLVYVNQWGAQDELVFDGNSIVYSCGGLSVCRSLGLGRGYGHDFKFQFENKFQLVNTDLRHNGNGDWYHENEHFVMTVLGLHDYGKKAGFRNFVVGSSGGIDSAVVLALATIAFGSDKVHAIMMPTVYSSEGSLTDAHALHDKLGISEYTKPITFKNEIELNKLHLKLDDINPVADENIQARLRGMTVMYFSNAMGALALTTGNKTELALGYCTLHGDMSGNFNPIGDLYKLEVYEMAKTINEYFGDEVIPKNIINKAPSAELAPDQTDEASLLPYRILDKIVQYYIEDYISDWNSFEQKLYTETPWNSVVVELKDGYVRRDEGVFQEEVKSLKEDIKNAKLKYDEMIKRIDNMEFKRRVATICTRLTSKAFGTGRRLPIIKKV